MEQEFESEQQYDNDGGYYEGEYYYDSKGFRYDQYGGAVDPSGRYYPPANDAMSEATGIFDDDDEEDPHANNQIVNSGHPAGPASSAPMAGLQSPGSPDMSKLKHSTIYEDDGLDILDVSMSEEVPETTERTSSPMLKPIQPSGDIEMRSPKKPTIPLSIPSVPQSQPVQQSSASTIAKPSEAAQSNEKDSKPATFSVPPPPSSLLKYIEEHPNNDVLKSKISTIVNRASNENGLASLKSPIRIRSLKSSSITSNNDLTELSKKYNIDEDLCTTMTQSSAKYTEEELAVEINAATKRATEEAQTIIAGLGGTIKRLQQEAQEYMDKNAELESANKEMHSVIEEVYEHLNMIKEEGAVEASKHYQEQIERIEEEYKKQIVELNNMMNEKNMTIESLKNDIAELNANQTRLLNELSHTTNECDSLRKQYEECASLRLSDQNTFNNTLKDKSKALDEYMDKYNQMKQALEEERQKISENIKEINLFTFNQEREKQKYMEKCKQLDELQKKYDEIKSQYNTISVSEASIKEQYTYVYNSYESLRQQLLALQKENNELKISLEGQTTIQTSQQIQEINHLKEQLIKSEQEVNRLKITLFDLQDPQKAKASLQMEDGSIIQPHQFIKELTDKNNTLQNNLVEQIHQNEDLLTWITQILESLSTSQ